MHIPKIITEHIAQYCDKLNTYPRIRSMYEACYLSTLKRLLNCARTTHILFLRAIFLPCGFVIALRRLRIMYHFRMTEVSKIIEGHTASLCTYRLILMQTLLIVFLTEMVTLKIFPQIIRGYSSENTRLTHCVILYASYISIGSIPAILKLSSRSLRRL